MTAYYPGKDTLTKKCVPRNPQKIEEKSALTSVGRNLYYTYDHIHKVTHDTSQ